MEFFAVAGPATEAIARILAQEEGGFQINLFWIVAQAASFLLFLVILYFAAFRRISTVLEERRSRIEQGLRDADQARREREEAANERLATLAKAREEADELLTRAQKVSEETRERDIAATRSELEQLRERAASDIAAEKERALAEVREQVADLALAAAARVVGETMNEPRERRLVEQFLSQMGGGNGRPTGRG